MRAFVYRNLHKPGYCYSIKALEGPHKGRVVGYSSFIQLTDVTFTVSLSGHARVLRTGHKNVHAGIVGIVASANVTSRLPNDIQWNGIDFPKDAVQITYNPWITDSFIVKQNSTPIRRAVSVLISGGLIEAINPL